MDRKAIIVIIILFTSAVFAFDKDSDSIDYYDVSKYIELPDNKNNLSNCHLYIGLTAGASFARTGSNQFDKTSSSWYSHYIPSNNYKFSPVYGINFGVENRVKNNILLSFGLGAYRTSSFRPSGQVWAIDTSDSSNNYHAYNYEYCFSNTRLMLETQISWLYYTVNASNFASVF